MALALPVLAWLLLVRPRRPTTDRPWTAEHARQAWAESADGRLTVHDLRDFDWGASPAVPRWRDETFALDDVSTVWLVVVPFRGAWRGAAHLFVTFGFRDGRHLAVSVEARRDTTQTYGLVAGTLRQYELIYVVGTERDLIGRRALVDGDPIHLYPVRTTPARARGLLAAMLARATRLRERPEFYHTLANNCTSNLIDHVNAIVPRRIPGGLKSILPGYADEVALAVGLVAPGSGEGVEALRAAHRVDDRARRAMTAADFSREIRADLPSRPE